VHGGQSTRPPMSHLGAGRDSMLALLAATATSSVQPLRLGLSPCQSTLSLPASAEYSIGLALNRPSPGNLASTKTETY